MATEIRPSLPSRHPANVEGVHAAMEALFNWNYGSEIDQLRTLYANALERQWIALRDLDWDAPFDKQAFTRSVSLGGFPIQQTEFWRSLPEDTRWEISRRSAAWMLSNFLHGEQGALMVASQLVAAVPHMDGKFYAATQTLDEARHVEVFAAYVRKIDEVQPISPGLKKLLDNVLATESWLEKAVGMQVVTEGLALYSFRDMRNAAEEPLLRKLLTYVSRDEARHTGYGVKYLSWVVPTLSDAERAGLEDFAYESARLLIDSRAGTSLRESVLGIWKSAGVDPAEALPRLLKERGAMRQELARSGGRFGPVRGFVIPTLRSIGLFSPRIQAHFEEIFTANFGPEMGDLSLDATELPADLEAWVNEGAEAL
jgi:hypothetical protein